MTVGKLRVMKLIPGLLFMFLSINSLACVCMLQKFAEKYTESDFVARARIIKAYKNEGEEELYKADILIYDLYKGHKIKSIYVEGRSDGKRGSSCAIFIPENTELIIYAKKYEKRNFIIGYCPGLVYLNQDKRTFIAERREIAMLDILKKRAVKYTGLLTLHPETGSFSGQTSRFTGISLNKNFALYELIFTADVKLKSVNVISGFDKKTDDELIKILNTSAWKANERNFARKSIPENSRFLIGFYYYPKEARYESFISENDL